MASAGESSEGAPPQAVDVVIVGGGVAGGALATALARDGLSVLVLERAEHYRDAVRGESIVPWGVRELIRLELLDALLEAGGHWTNRWVSYDEVLEPEEAERRALPLDGLISGVSGSLNIAHPTACRALNQAARSAGARFMVGAQVLECRLGSRPQVEFRLRNRTHVVRCRLVIGADGRNSVLRKTLGVPIRRTAPPHMVGGLLVSGLEGIWAEAEVQAVEGSTYFLGMPQKDGWARVYLGFPLDERRRFTGPLAAERFLQAAHCRCMPSSDRWVAGVIAGPCASFTAEDLWPDSPVGEGLLLIGDAAGYMNPLIGQGTASAFRDVRVVRDVMRETIEWSPGCFAPYVSERQERFRRICAVGRLYAAIFADFRPGAGDRRRLVSERMQQDPRLLLPVAAMFSGPETIPSADFVERSQSRLLAAKVAAVAYS